MSTNFPGLYKIFVLRDTVVYNSHIKYTHRRPGKKKRYADQSLENCVHSRLVFFPDKYIEQIM